MSLSGSVGENIEQICNSQGSSIDKLKESQGGSSNHGL